MFEFLKRFFSKTEQVDPDAMVEELWETELEAAGNGRFPEVDLSDHGATYDGSGYLLSLRKRDLFAWVLDPLYRYDDFSLEVDFAFAPGSGHGSAGIAFRAVDEENFYYLLVSNRGFWRMDTVFNGVPRPIVPWTELHAPASRETFRLRLLARSEKFTVVVNEEWAGEAEDDTFTDGRIGLAAQNYGDSDNLEVRFLGLELESRAIEVESAWYQWNSAIPAKPEARVALALAHAASGEWLKSAIQLKKAARGRVPSPDEAFYLAEAYANLSLWDEALAALEALLAEDPSNARAAQEKANALYLSGRYLDLRDWLASRAEELSGDAVAVNLAGHAEFNLGNMEKAALLYDEAVRLEPTMAIFHLNAARAWSPVDPDRALPRYAEAARLFFLDGAYDDCREILPIIATLAPGDPLTKALEGKMAWASGDFRLAKALFAPLLAAGTADSSVRYLSGLMALREGDPSRAKPHFEAARDGEGGFAPYRFRLAETLLLLDRDDEAERELNAAIELDPDSGWAWNLRGMTAMKASRLEEALDAFSKAVESLPGEVDPAINRSEALLRLGKADEAIAALGAYPNSPEARNRLGNLFAGSGRLGDALAAYRDAVRIAPDNRDFRLNLAAACMEADLLSEAETELSRALESGPDARACLLSGNLSEIYGDRVRAETAFRLGLEFAPSDPDLLAALFENYRIRLKFDKAKAILDDFAAMYPGERAEAMSRRYESSTTDVLSCASCGREWRTPKPLPYQGELRVACEPPDESPAGICPQCGSVYCVGCRKDRLENDRLTCARCGVPLKLSDDRLKYLVRSFLGTR